MCHRATLPDMPAESTVNNNYYYVIPWHDVCRQEEAAAAVSEVGFYVLD